MHIINQARVNFEYSLNNSCSLIRITAYSNYVKTYIRKKAIYIEIFVDKDKAVIYDILNYTVIIKNISEMPVENLYLSNLYTSEYTKLIRNSVYIEENKKMCMDLDDIMQIGRLNENQSVKIKFQMVVKPGSVRKYIYNSVIARFDYIYNNLCNPQKIDVMSNRIKVCIEDALFKEITVSSILKINLRHFSDINVKARAEIYNNRIAASKMNYTNEHPEKNLCKLIIVGVVTYQISAIIRKHRNRKKVFSVNAPFSCFLMVPYGINYFKNSNVEIEIENIMSDAIGVNKLFVNTEMMIRIK